MPVDELLAQLKDITGPVEPGWWPLAMGWWYLMGLVLLIAISVYSFKKHKITSRPFVSANTELQALKEQYLKDNDAGKLAVALSEWLKRIALYAFPDEQPAGLTGQAWIKFLDERAGHAFFTDGPGQAFSNIIYDNRSQLDGRQLLDVCERWLIAVRPQLNGKDKR